MPLSIGPENNIRYETDEQGGSMLEADIKRIEAEATEHVEQNTMPIDLDGTICSDDRTTAEQGEGKIARLGADAGYALLFISLGKTAQEAFDLVSEYRQSQGRIFEYHTDEHAADAHDHTADAHEHAADAHDHTHGEQDNPDAPVIGCGHLFKASLEKNAKLFGIDPVEVRNLIEIIQNAPENIVKKIVLAGPHAAKGVLRIHDTENTVVASDLARKSNYFIYNVDADNKVVAQLFDWLRDKKQMYFELKAIKRTVDTHNNATLGLLAGNLPLIDVYHEPGQTKIREVKFAAIIPAAA